MAIMMNEIEFCSVGCISIGGQVFADIIQRRSAGNGFTFVSFQHTVEEVSPLITRRHANPNLPTRINTASMPLLDL
jgi:hypothetical protein